MYLLLRILYSKLVFLRAKSCDLQIFPLVINSRYTVYYSYAHQILWYHVRQQDTQIKNHLLIVRTVKEVSQVWDHVIAGSSDQSIHDSSFL